MKTYYYGKDCSWIYDGKYSNNIKDKLGNNITGIIFAEEYDDIIRVVSNGLAHNMSGPAVIRKNGSIEYYVNGCHIGSSLSNKEFNQKIKEIVFK